eukprot:gene7444-10144_t
MPLWFITIILIYFIGISNSQLELCQSNCESSDRLVGPTRMTGTQPHPWSITEYPTGFSGFCKLGCTLFFSETPRNSTCQNLCGYFYRYKVTSQYSDLAEEAKLECQDGCEIALTVCQAGYYCSSGEMTACPPGTYREAVTDISILALDKAHSCTACPYGRYRSASKGASADECTKCPIGKYANVTGSVKDSDCQRCPAGKNAEEPGMKLCKCITQESCNLEINGIEYFGDKNGVDFNRETIPFIGRW